MAAHKMTISVSLRVVAIVALFFSGSPAFSQDAAFDDWLAALKAEALANGISQKTADEALDGLTLDPKVIELDNRQPEFTLTFDHYMTTRLSQSRIAKGVEKMAANKTTLDAVANEYGVDGRFISAIWGLETNYGGYTGNMSTIRSLVTLAYDPRRSNYFRREVMSALHIIDAGHISAADMKGSWAGAMGQSQFMPSSFNAYARDYDGDGRDDIWTNEGDVFASIANYLKNHNWQTEGTWGRPVILPNGFDINSADLKQVEAPSRCKNALKSHTRMLPLSRWRELGVKRLNGSDLPNVDVEASLVQPGGEGGRAYLTYENYRSILGYNCSNYYAIAVGSLADKLRDGAK